jgi:uncharacterized protein with GYD domain
MTGFDILTRDIRHVSKDDSRPTYVLLSILTDEGAKTVKEEPERIFEDN